MRVTLPVIFTLSFVAVALGLPAPQQKDEVEVVPLEKNNPYGDQPIIDTGAGGWSDQFSSPFSGLFENIEGIMARMRQQMESLLRHFPVSRAGNSSVEVPDFPVESVLSPFPQFGDIDLSKGNTTSVTKVIDGHKVVINETEYKKEDDFGGAFFKVRIIDVKPDSSELTTEKEAEEVTGSTSQPTAPAIKDRESVENSVENEILKSNEVTNFGNLETFDEVSVLAPSQNTGYYLDNRNAEWNEVGAFEPFEDNSINFGVQNLPIDLSRDTYVNQLLADAGAPTNPDAEVFFVPQNPRSTGQFEKIINPR